MILVYENDRHGKPVSGKLQDLAAAAAEGRTIKCSMVDKDGNTEMFSFERVVVGRDGHVYGLAPVRIANFALSDTGVHFNYFDKARVSVFGTDGREVIKRAAKGFIRNECALKWYAG